jgi:plasmid stability protein
MANLTLTLDEALLRRARVRALELGTSVNAVAREYLTSFADGPAGRQGIDAFLDLGRAVRAQAGPLEVWPTSRTSGGLGGCG